MADALAAYCGDAGTPDEETTGELRRHLLDWIGLVVGGREHAQSSASVLDALDTLVGDGEIGSGIPTGAALSADRAALLSGTFAHSLDFDDTHRESSLHPGAPVIAASLPVAREEGSTGRELLSAISLGYDVTCALGRAVNPDAHYARGFHLTATCGTFGATAAVGHLRGFDAAGFESAFGVNGSQTAGSLQFLENGAWNKRLHPGLAASRGVLAGALTDAGFRGAEKPIEGTFGFLHGYTDDPNPEALATISPGTAVMETALKPYPCCRYMHAAIDALLDLRADLAPDTVESVTIDLPGPGVRLTGDPIERKRRPENFVDCQFSVPFAAALALSTGEADLGAFLDAQDELDDPALRALMDRVAVVSTERTNEPFPAQWTAHVVVETTDRNERHERFVEHPRGEPEDPLSWRTIETKFRDLVRSTALDGTADAVIDAVSGLGSRSTTGDLFDAIERP